MTEDRLNPILVEALGGLIGGSLLAAGIAVLGVVKNWWARPTFWLALIAFSSLGALVALLVMRKKTDRGNRKPFVTGMSRLWRKPRTAAYLGVDVGRTVNTLGIVCTAAQRAPKLPGRGIHVESVVQRRSLLGVGYQKQFYDDLLDAIRDVVRNYGPVDGIGIGFPGLVDAGTGVVAESPGGLARNEPLIEKLAERIATDRELTREVLQTTPDRPLTELHESAIQRMRLDNDSNCSARAALNWHLAESDWRNFACIMIGTGVGSGLVLDGRLFYGSQSYAGEIGHTIISTAENLSSTANPYSSATRSPRCLCGRDDSGTHFESFVNAAALEALAKELNPEMFQRAVHLFRAWSPKERGTDDHGIGIAQTEFGAMLLSEIASRLSRRRKGAHEQPTGASSAIEELLADDAFASFVDGVVEIHARRVGVGLANLINLLNLDRILLGGGVIDGFWEYEGYRSELLRELDRSLLASSRASLEERVYHHTFQGTRVSWQGAALALIDPSHPAHS